MTPIYGSTTPRYKILLALYGKARGWNCKVCPFCGADGFHKCKNWIAHMGASHGNEPLIRVADDIWKLAKEYKFEDDEALEKFVQKQGRERGVIE